MTTKEIFNKFNTFYCIFTPSQPEDSGNFKEFIAQFISAGASDSTEYTKRPRLLLKQINMANVPGKLIMVPVTGKMVSKACTVGSFNHICSGTICGDDGIILADMTHTNVVSLPDTIENGESTPYVGFMEIREGDRF